MNNKKNKYPTLRVITLYPLLGGLVGGSPLIIIGLLMLIDDPKTIEGTLIILFFICGIGFIPALLTGILLAYFKVKILKVMDYFKAF